MPGGTGWSKNGIGKSRRSRSRASTPSRFFRCCNPLRGLFREAALAGASNDDGNDGHAFIPCSSSKEKRWVDKGNRLSLGPSLVDRSAPTPAPIPRAPPVTITVRLWKRFMILSFNLVTRACDALAGGVRVGIGQDGPNEVPEIELDRAPLAVARFEGLAVQLTKGRPLRGLPEGVYLRSQRRVGGKCRGVDEPLDVGEREQIEPGHSLGEGIDEIYELLVGDRAVDVAVLHGELAVEVMAADENLGGTGAI